MISLELDKAALAQAAQRAGATEEMVAQATTAALRTVQKSIEKRVKSRAAKELRLPQRAISGRFFTNNVAADKNTLRLWAGAWTLSPFRLGVPSIYGVPGKSGGIRAGRYSYPGAFLASIHGGRPKIWIRLRSKHFSPDLYPTRHRPGDRGLGSDPALRHRFPVVRAAVPIDEILGQVMHQEAASLSAEFIAEFSRELAKQNEQAARDG